MKQTEQKYEVIGHPITWESLLAVIGAGVILTVLGGGVAFWLKFFGA